MTPLEQLAPHWREEAARLRRYGGEAAARALETAATDLEEALAHAGDELLTLEEAARESDYSIDHLRRLLRERPALNAGRRGALRIRRRDLPRKATTLRPAQPLSIVPREQVARSVLHRDTGGE